jgi:FkbM family methyltransferase
VDAFVSEAGRDALLAGIRGLLRRSRIIDRDPFKGFLRDVKGVIHVGAHTGQERGLYADYRLKVLWVEPLAESFATLEENLVGFPNQRALQCLVTDRDNAEYSFHVTSNAGASSSIFVLDLHKDIWPDVKHMKTIPMRSRTLATLLADERAELSEYDALAMDTQGSELLVLKGAEPILREFLYIKTEVADFAAYKGCCQLADIESYVSTFGFTELARKVIASHARGGAYYDIVYKRAS